MDSCLAGMNKYVAGRPIFEQGCIKLWQDGPSISKKEKTRARLSDS